MLIPTVRYLTMAKKKKKKVPLRKLLRRWERKADKAFSEYVRAFTKLTISPKCPLCGINEIQCCFHFIRRRRKVLRWDIRNVVGACHRCNYIEYRDPDLSRAWFLKTRGLTQYLDLVEMSKDTFIPTLEYLQQVTEDFIRYKAELK